MSYAQDSAVFVEISSRLYEKSYFLPVSDCILFTGASIDCGGVSYGRMKAKLPPDFKSKAYYAHRLAVMAHRLTVLDKTTEVSHLCCHSLCINPHHLSIEPHNINLNRRSCQSHRHCNGHGDYPNCYV